MTPKQEFVKFITSVEGVSDTNKAHLKVVSETLSEGQLKAIVDLLERVSVERFDDGEQQGYYTSD